MKKLLGIGIIALAIGLQAFAFHATEQMPDPEAQYIVEYSQSPHPPQQEPPAGDGETGQAPERDDHPDVPYCSPQEKEEKLKCSCTMQVEDPTQCTSGKPTHENRMCKVYCNMKKCRCCHS
jgi:hypothetical protein